MHGIFGTVLNTIRNSHGISNRVTKEVPERRLSLFKRLSGDGVIPGLQGMEVKVYERMGAILVWNKLFPLAKSKA